MHKHTTTEAPQKADLKQHKEAIADYDKAIELDYKRCIDQLTTTEA